MFSHELLTTLPEFQINLFSKLAVSAIVQNTLHSCSQRLLCTHRAHVASQGSLEPTVRKEPG